MSAFAAAMATLAADPNVGVDATWISASGGPSLAVRVVPVMEEADAFAAAPMIGERVRARIAADALPGRPQRNDLIAFNDVGYKVESVQTDIRGASFVMTLVKDGA